MMQRGEQLAILLREPHASATVLYEVVEAHQTCDSIVLGASDMRFSVANEQNAVSAM